MRLWIATALVIMCVVAAPSQSSVRLLAVQELPPKLEIIGGNSTIAITVPWVEIPLGAVLSSSAEVVVLTGNGLEVISTNGKRTRQLGDDVVGGTTKLALLKPGWVAAVSTAGLSAYRVDGRRTSIIIDRSLTYSNNLLSVSGGRLAAAAGRQLTLYGGWPPKLLAKSRLHDDITAVEQISPSTLAVGTVENAHWNGVPPRPIGNVTLYKMRMPDLRIIRQRELGKAGLLMGLKKLDHVVAAGLRVCKPGAPDAIRFVGFDLSDAPNASLNVDGLNSMASIGDRVYFVKMPCHTSGDGYLWSYDLGSNRLEHIADGPSQIYAESGE